MMRSSANGKGQLQVLVGIVFSLLLLLLAFWGVEWSGLMHSLGRVDWFMLVLAIPLLGSSLLARAFRWQALLAPLVKTRLVDAFSYTMIGYLVNNVLPFRLGEIIRAGLLGEKLQTSRAGVFATAVVERLLDVLSLLVFIAALLIMLELPGVVQSSILLGEAFAVIAIVALCVLAWRDGGLERLVPRIVPNGFRRHLVAALGGFLCGLQVLRSGRHLMMALAWSLLSWGLFVVSICLLLRASGLVELPWYSSLLVVVVTNLGSAIPSSPGFLGGYHFLAVFSLAFWSVPKSDALGFAILVHGLNYLVVTGLGVMALWRENIAFGRLRQQAQPQTRSPAQKEAG